MFRHVLNEDKRSYGMRSASRGFGYTVAECQWGMSWVPVSADNFKYVRCKLVTDASVRETS